MIYSLTGTLLEKTAGEAVIECGGIGYLVALPATAVGALPAVGHTATVYTHLAVSENDVSLYGFESAEQRQMFLLLTSVSGVGPKVGLSILGAMSPAQVVLAVSSGDHKAFTAAQGVGPKLGQRLVLELADKLKGFSAGGGLSVADIASAAGPAAQGPAQQAVAALVALGYTQSEAAAAVAPIDPGLGVSEMVRLALRGLGSR